MIWGWLIVVLVCVGVALLAWAACVVGAKADKYQELMFEDWERIADERRRQISKTL